MALRLFRGKDGRLTAYATEPDGLVRWTEDRPGGPEWTGPQRFEHPDVSRMTLAQGPDRYVHLVGLRHRAGAGGSRATDVVFATQFQSGRPFTGWHSLGTPHPKDPARARRTGDPAVAVDSEGCVHVAVVTADRTVSARRQDNKGKWSAWAPLKGDEKDALGGLSAAATADGRIEVVAPAGDGLRHWHRAEPDAEWERGPDVPGRPREDSLCSADTGSDTVTHFWRDARDGGVRAWRREAGAVASLGGGTGTGPVAMVRTEVDGHECTVLAQRDGAEDRLAVAAYPTGDEEAGVFWTPTCERGADHPALAVDGLGRLVLAALAGDGGLLVARRKTDESGLALCAWTRV